MTSPALSDDLPTQTHPGYDRMSAGWAEARDLMGGTKALRAATTRYLPKHPKERQDDYAIRLAASTLYNGFARTVAAMTGLVMQRDPTLGEDNPAPVAQAWENIDGSDTHGALFVRRLLREGLVTGRAGIHVDFARVASPETLSKADEASLGLRPYWVLVRAEDIRSWMHVAEGGRQVLEQLVLRQTSTVRKGRYGTGSKTEYLVYLRVARGEITCERWLETAETVGGQPKVVLVSTDTIRNQDEIPFVLFVAGEHDAPFEAAPPLSDLADLNLAHYQVASDRRSLMHKACVPVPVRKGYRPTAEGTEMAIGPNILVDVDKDGDFKWAEVSGSAFQPTGEELDRLERQMAALGLAFLQSETRAAETAMAKRLDATAQNASLAAVARALQDALEMALGFHARYLNLDGGSADINREFERVMLAPEMILALSQLEQAGQLSLETFLHVVQAGHVLPDDFDVDQEVTRILAGVRAMAGMAPMIDPAIPARKEVAAPPPHA